MSVCVGVMRPISTINLEKHLDDVNDGSLLIYLSFQNKGSRCFFSFLFLEGKHNAEINKPVDELMYRLNTSRFPTREHVEKYMNINTFRKELKYNISS